MRRGHLVPIGLIIVILFLNCAVYRRTIKWQWPVQRWTMYGPKGSTRPVAEYRRFVAHHADGTREAIDLGRAVAFLEEPYRLDYGLDRNRSAFLLICLRELRRNEGPDTIGLSVEHRSWNYEESSFSEHLAEPPARSFRATEIDLPATRSPAGETLLANGDFKKWRMRSGAPRTWNLDGNWFGIGIDSADRNRAFMLVAAPAPQALDQVVTVPPGKIRLVVLTRALEPGATIELETPSGSQRAEVPGDGQWHEIELVAETPAGGQARVILRSNGAAEVLYDDIALYPEGG